MGKTGKPGLGGILPRLGVEVVGEGIEGLFSLASATVTGIGSAVGGIAQGIGTAVGGALTPAPKTIVNNFGIAGSAAKSKVTGGGTLPALKKAAKPIVNANMPTEKLLVVAVNYLSSIDNTLQAQIKFERDSFVQQAQAERESAIESGGQKDSIFTRLSNKFSGMSDDSTIKSRAGTITKAILAGAGIAGLGLLAIGNLDTKELDRLKDSYKAFNEKFDFLGPLADGVASTGSIFGYMLGGMKGAIFGLVAEYLTERFTGKSIFENITGTGEEADGTQAPRKDGSYDYAMAGGLAAYGAYRGVKTFGKIKNARANIAKAQATPRLSASGGRLGFRDPVTGKIASKAASSAGGGWLSGPKGRRFVAFLSKRFGKTFLARKIMPFLGKALVGIGIAATGIGVIPGALLTLITVASSALLIYDIISAYWDWTEEEDMLGDAQTTSGLKPKPDASPISSSNNIAGAPIASTSASPSAMPSGSLPPAASGSIDAILDKTPQELTDAELRQLVERQGRIENPSGSLNNPGGLPVASARTTPYAGNVVGEVGATGNSSIRIASFDTAENGTLAAMWLWRNGRNYRGKSVRDGLGAWSTGVSGRNPNYEHMLGSSRSGWTGTNNPVTGSSESSVASNLANLGKGAMEALGTIARASFGKQDYSPGSQLNRFNDTMQGNAATAVPNKGATDVTETLKDMSAQAQIAVDLGTKNKTQAEIKQESAGATLSSKPNSSNDDKRDHFDPNYPGQGSLNAYVQYHKLAA